MRQVASGRFQATYKSVQYGDANLGTFDTAVEAARAYAKRLAEDAEREEEGDESLVTEAEGYKLILSKKSKTGYKGVKLYEHGRYYAAFS